MINNNYLTLEGIFRVSGDNDTISMLQNKINYNDDDNDQLDFNDYDPHVLAGLIKRYFRELPTPLFTYELYQPLITAIIENKNKEEIYDMLSSLPKDQYTLTIYLLDFLKEIVIEDHNKMSAKNLAIVFAPNLLRSKITTYETMAKDTPFIISVLQKIIEYHSEIYQDKHNEFLPLTNSLNNPKIDNINSYLDTSIRQYAWSKQYDHHQQIYYYNHETDEKTVIKPEDYIDTDDDDDEIDQFITSNANINSSYTITKEEEEEEEDHLNENKHNDDDDDEISFFKRANEQISKTINPSNYILTRKTTQPFTETEKNNVLDNALNDLEFDHTSSSLSLSSKKKNSVK